MKSNVSVLLKQTNSTMFLCSSRLSVAFFLFFLFFLARLLRHHEVQQLTQHFATYVTASLKEAPRWLNANCPPRGNAYFPFAGTSAYITLIRGDTLPQRTYTPLRWVVIAAPALVRPPENRAVKAGKKREIWQNDGGKEVWKV